MKTKNITANGEFFFFSIGGQEEKEFIEGVNKLRFSQNKDIEIIGYCSEIIKDEELAKRVVGDTNSFASLLQANDIDLDVQDWFVVKKI